MNPLYHHQPYPDLNSPHSPSSDGIPSSYRGHTPTGGPPNGQIMGSHHELMHQHAAYSAAGPSPLNHRGGGTTSGPNPMNNFHHHYHHFLNNNNLSSNSSNNGNMNGNNQCHGNTICAGCQSKINDRYLLMALNQPWHHGCLKCSACQCTLYDMGTSCFTRNNLILCKMDYAKRYGPPPGGACAGCNNRIPPHEMVMRAGGPNTFGASPNSSRSSQVYHPSCFVCSKCQVRLQPGDKYYVMTNGSPVCEKDWLTFAKGANVPGQQTPTGTAVRKGKVGRPRRSRD